MSAKQIKQAQEVYTISLKALNTVLYAVAPTLGPRGRNAMIESAYGGPKVTKDGATVVKAIELEDKAQNMIVQAVVQISSTTSDEAGDGTTTATILGITFTSTGIKYIVSGMDPMSLNRGMKKAVNCVVEELKKMSIPCTDFESIEQVGTISSNGDRAVGKLIAQAMKQVGKNGVTTVEEGSGIEDELKVVEGMQLDRGYISPYFITNSQAGTAELENPYILLVDKKLSSHQDLIGLLEKVIQAGRSIFIIAEDVEGEALSVLIVNKLRGHMKACAVKAPGFGDRRKEILQDIAILTNANVISEEVGLTLGKASLEDLGTAKRIVVDKESFTVIDGGGNQSTIETRISEINTQMDACTSSFEKEKYQERLAKLSGGVAVLKVGAATEVEMKEKSARVRDALNATRAAIEEGIVPGGGVALLRTAKALEELKGENVDENAGISIIAESLRSPLNHIVKNAGGESAIVVDKLLHGEGSQNINYGYNAATDEYGDMLKMGIVDPTKVTRTALQKAASIAGMLITTECMIVEIPKKEESASVPQGMGGMGGMDMM